MRTFFAAAGGLLVAAGLVALIIGATDLGSASPLILILVVIVGGIAAVVGGFVTARIQPSPRAVSAFAVLYLFLTLAALSWRAPLPGWFRLFALLIVIPAAALGGKVGGAPVAEPTVARPGSGENSATQSDSGDLHSSANVNQATRYS